MAYYVPVLDGVSARVRFGHQSNGAFTSTYPIGGLVAGDGGDAPVVVVPLGLGGWGRGYVQVLEETIPGGRTVTVLFDGTSLPAMPNGATPDGVTLVMGTWMSQDGNIIDGFYSSSGPWGGDRQYTVAFVPYFRMEEASTTQSLQGNQDQFFYIYLAKPLNYNQTNRLVATTSSNGPALTVSYETNTYGQVTAVKVRVPAAAAVPNSVGFTFHLNITEQLTYLKNTVFVTETITHLNKDYTVPVVATVDSNPPTIGTARIHPVSEMGSNTQSMAYQFNCHGESGITGLFAITVKATDPGSGVAKVELWWEGSPQFMVDSADSNSSQAWDALWTSTGAQGWQFSCHSTQFPEGVTQGKFLVKVYDKSGNVASRYVDPPFSGTPQSVWMVNPVASSTLYPRGGTLNTTTGAWSAITSMAVRVEGAAAFVSSVEFLMDNVSQGTIAGSSPDANPSGYNELAAEYTGTFNVPAGTHNITIRVTDKVGDTADTTASVTVSSFGGGGGGGGCVDYQAPVLMADGTTRPAIEVRAGDEVLTRNPFTGAFEVRTIGEVLLRGDQPCYRVVMSDGVEGIMSESHRIYEPTRDAFFEVKDYRPGMSVLRPGGAVAQVVSLEPLGERPVLTFSIHDPLNRNYFASDTLAHNKISQDCVLPGTLITMADGTRQPIETVNPGDQILAWNTKTKEFEPDTVLSHFVTRNGRLFRVTLDNGMAVTCTGTHVIYANDMWLSVTELQRYQSPVKVLVEDGTTCTIQSITPVDMSPETEVRLVEVRNNHNLCLGGILCHNITKVPNDQTMALYVDGVYMGQVAV